MANVFRNLDWSVATDVIARVAAALVCITFHELAHGFTAYRLGDRTAKDMGRLTLNPIKHIDVFGLLMMIAFRFGWAKPVPVNMYNFRRPKWYMAITAIAGPLSNIILATVVAFIYGLLFTLLGGRGARGAGGFALDMMDTIAYLSIALAVFNMLPIPPLDGSKVLFSVLSEGAYFRLMRYERYGMILLIVFINIDRFLDTTIFSDTVGRLTGILSDGLSTVWFAAYRLVN